MTAKKPRRVRILMMPYREDENSDPVGHSGPATVLTGLPRTIRRHELRLIVPLADSTIYEMEKRGEFPRRFNLAPRCVVGSRRGRNVAPTAPADLSGRTREDGACPCPAPDVRQRKTRAVKAQKSDL